MWREHSTRCVRRGGLGGCGIVCERASDRKGEERRGEERRGVERRGEEKLTSFLFQAFSRTRVIEISMSVQFASPKDQIQIVTPSRMFLKEATIPRFLSSLFLSSPSFSSLLSPLSHILPPSLPILSFSFSSILPGTSVVLRAHRVFLFSDILLFCFERTATPQGSSSSHGVIGGEKEACMCVCV